VSGGSGVVPVLELSEGVCLSQSAAIMRYIGEWVSE
jgi:glutathione S-transferase